MSQDLSARRSAPLLKIIKLKEVGAQYFETWKFASSYEHENNYKLDFFETKDRVGFHPHRDEMVRAFRAGDGAYLLHDEDEFFDFGEFAIYTSIYNDWVVLANVEDFAFQRPEGFRGHSGFADYSQQDLRELRWAF